MIAWYILSGPSIGEGGVGQNPLSTPNARLEKEKTQDQFKVDKRLCQLIPRSPDHKTSFKLDPWPLDELTDQP